VVTERLLIQVAVKIEGLNRNVSTADAALQQTPEVLKAIGMNLTIEVFDSMIDNPVIRRSRLLTCILRALPPMKVSSTATPPLFDPPIFIN
jgi:hypothetical protein